MSKTNFVVIKAAVAAAPERRGQESKFTVLSTAGVQSMRGEGGETFQQAFFQQVRAFGKEGDSAKNLPAGTPVVIKGKLVHKSWKNEDGTWSNADYVKAVSIRPAPDAEKLKVEERQSSAGNTYHILTTDAFVNVTLEGGLVRDPELAYTSDGKAYLRGTFGCEETYYDQGVEKKIDNFISFQVWGERAEEISNLGIGKGAQLTLLGGTIRNGSYTSSKNGRKVYTCEVEEGNGRFDFFPKRGAGGGASAGIDIDDAMSMGLDDGGDEGLPF